MEGRKQVLLLWLEKVTKQKISSIKELRNCKLLQNMLSDIEGFAFDENEDSNDWKHCYKRLKGLHQQIDAFIKNNITKIPECSFQTLNFVEIAKGQSQEGLQGLQTILNLIFVVCLNSPDKEIYINCIMALPISSQQTIMTIIEQSQINLQQKQQPSAIDYYKEQLRKMEFNCQSLVSQNMSFRMAMDEDNEALKKNEELIKKYEKQNASLVRELQEKNQFIRTRQDTLLDRYSQSNEELVEQLKKTLLQRQQSYTSQIFNLKQHIYSLNESILQHKRTTQDLQEQQSRRSLNQSRNQHMNCIPLEKYKSKINQMMANTKEATQKELQSKLENIKLKNTIAELQSKNKKLMESLQKKDNDMMISGEDGQKLKIEFFTRVRDSLKEKLQSYQRERFKKQPQNKLDDFLND